MIQTNFDTTAAAFEVRRRDSYPAENLGFLQRTHPLRGRPFGQLVYMADSVMQPMLRPGFGMHPHVNVEVVSYVLDGELTHRDSAGNLGIVPAGGLQRITAGTGIEHDESNQTGNPLRMFQIWFAPKLLDITPSYATIETAGKVPNGDFRRFIGNTAGALSVNADATISLGHLAVGEEMTIEGRQGRATMLYVVDGAIGVESERVGRQDQVRMLGGGQLRLKALETADLLLIESAI
jgi:quercetin 2,3-dioxygenase